MKNNQLTPSPYQECHRDKMRSKLLSIGGEGFPAVMVETFQRKNELLCNQPPFALVSQYLG